MENTGVIGLGDMGSGLAENLIKNVFPVKGFDLSESRMKTFAEIGGKLTSNPALVFCF
jgi:putative dehydrogenase